MEVFNLLTAIFLPMATSLDKTAALFKPLWYRKSSTTNRAQLITFFIWVACTFWTFPLFFENAIKEEVCNFNSTDSSLFTQSQLRLYLLSLFAIGVFGSSVVVVAANISLVLKLRQKSSTLSRRDREVTLSLIVVSVSFFLCQMSMGVITGFETVRAANDSKMASLLNAIKVSSTSDLFLISRKLFSLLNSD